MRWQRDGLVSAGITRECVINAGLAASSFLETRTSEVGAVNISIFSDEVSNPKPTVITNNFS
jgi:hypothetical protein